MNTEQIVRPDAHTVQLNRLGRKLAQARGARDKARLENKAIRLALRDVAGKVYTEQLSRAEADVRRLNAQLAVMQEVIGFATHIVQQNGVRQNGQHSES